MSFLRTLTFNFDISVFSDTDSSKRKLKKKAISTKFMSLKSKNI